MKEARFRLIRRATDCGLWFDAVEHLLTLSRRYVRLKTRQANGEEVDKQIDRLEEQIIDFVEEFNNSSPVKKIFVAWYSLSPLKLYELSTYTDRTGNEYRREDYYSINQWLFAHSNDYASIS